MSSFWGPFLNFVSSDSLKKIIADFPEVAQSGSFPLEELKGGKHFTDLIESPNAPEFQQAVSKKFGVELMDRPMMITVRRRCRRKDGRIHTDSSDKVISLLLYLNENWRDEGGRLRLLRSKYLEDYAEEITPQSGTLVGFRRSDCSFHGHRPFEGVRRAIQINWVSDQRRAKRHQLRHKWSALMKRFGQTFNVQQ